MSEIVKSTFKAGKVLECLFEDDFQGKTIQEISKRIGIDELAVRRAVLTWEELGWIIKTPIAGEKSARWKVSNKLSKIAHAYERHALNQIHAIKNDFQEVAGKELNS